jgi:predicted NBD/HSP70 family sugar kinase
LTPELRPEAGPEPDGELTREPTRTSGGEDTATLRRQNAARVLRSLRSDGPGTRAELAKRTALAKATIGTIVAGLQAAVAVVEDESQPDGRGRPGRPVRLAGSAFLGLGFELNVDYVAAVALDLSGEVQFSEIRPAPGPITSDADFARHPLFDLAREVCERFPASDHRFLGSTVAVPGLVGEDNRTMAWTPNLGIEGPALADRLALALGSRTVVWVENDANCAALAEAHRGAALGAAHALYLTGTVGIGAGIVQEGRLVRGAAGLAGEVGHLPIGDPAAQCGCGRRGCWEASIGLLAMLSAAGMPELDTPIGSAEQVAERAATDVRVAVAVEQLGERVGLGLAMLSDVLDPAVIVLGGYFVPLGELVLNPTRGVLADRAGTRRAPPELRLSTLGIHAAALGAAEESLRPTFAGEVPLLG